VERRSAIEELMDACGMGIAEEVGDDDRRTDVECHRETHSGRWTASLEGNVDRWTRAEWQSRRESLVVENRYLSNMCNLVGPQNMQ
jgi:type IV secretory pathway ATPase VirB11/archaellum biosynthesis ATPase